jgi:perosamine synthetase
MDAFLAMRRNVHEGYEAALGHLPGISFPPPMPARYEPVTWFSCALVPAEARPKLIEACRQANIDLRPFFHGLSSMPAYRCYARKCPHSERLSACGINLPTSRKVDAQTVTRIAEIFAGVLTGDGGRSESE